jgi:hypothetical protein
MVDYTVQVCDDGVVVTGFLPMSDLKYVTMLAAHHGFDVLDLVGAKARDVTLLVTTKEALTARENARV